MIKALVIVGLITVPAAVGLGIWNGQNHVPAETVVAMRQNAPLVAKPGRAAASAAKTFAKLDPPPPPAPKPLGPPAPPPPDIAVVFRQDIRALAPDQGRVILAGSRSLKLGEPYRDGWKLANLTNRGVTLQKGKEQRAIDLFQPDPAAVQALAARSAQPVGMAQVSFTNGLKPGQLPAPMIAQLMAMMRQGGLAQAQIDQMKKALETGPASQNQLMPIVMALARNGRVPVTDLTRFIENLGKAGVIQANQVSPLEQGVAQVAQSRQTDTIVQQLGRPGAPGQGQFGAGGRGGFPGQGVPGQGFGGGGFGGRGQGGFGQGGFGGQGRRNGPAATIQPIPLAPATGSSPIVRTTP